MIGNLTNHTVTRPGISYVVGLLSQFMNNQRIFIERFLREFLLRLKALLEKNYSIRSIDILMSLHILMHDMREVKVIGSQPLVILYFFWGNLVIWRSKRGNVISWSSDETEHRGMAHTACEVLWLKKLLTKFGFKANGNTFIYYDN